MSERDPAGEIPFAGVDVSVGDAPTLRGVAIALVVGVVRGLQCEHNKHTIHNKYSLCT